MKVVRKLFNEKQLSRLQKSRLSPLEKRDIQFFEQKFHGWDVEPAVSTVLVEGPSRRRILISCSSHFPINQLNIA